MRFSIDVGSELELKLYQAVLLYKNDHGNRHMATVHGVVQQNGDGSPVLGAGQLLSTAACGSWPAAGDRLPGGVPAGPRRRANSGLAGVVDAGGGAANVLPRWIGT
jgi:hypothetical protein